MVLHDLCASLNDSGHEAAILFLHNGSSAMQDFEFAVSNNPDHHKKNVGFYLFHENYKDEIADFINNGVVIYPDLITGNPLAAARVVRYILNFSDKEFANDFVLSYSSCYHSNATFSLFKVFDNPFIHENNTLSWSERTLNATYIGKGSSYGECYRVKDSILIDRDWPKDKEQLGLLLRQVKYFYSWDNVSATNLDAVLCGCVPVFLGNLYKDKAAVDKMEPGPYPEINCQFIDSDLTLDFNINDVDESLIAMKSKLKTLSSNWNERVKEFAFRCESFFAK